VQGVATLCSKQDREYQLFSINTTVGSQSQKSRKSP
jgi:hypothetical protein